MKSLLRGSCVAALAALFIGIVSSANAAEMSKRSVSMKVDEAHGLCSFYASERSWTATEAGMALGELTEFVQSSTSQDIEGAVMTKMKDTKQYVVTVSIKIAAKGEKLAIAPMIPGLTGIDFVGNCPVNSSFEAQFADAEQLAKLTPEQKQQVQTAVVILSAFNHRLPWDQKAELMKPKAQIGKAWTIEAIFPKAAFEKSELSLKKGKVGSASAI